jgi:hypothetical protein
MDTIVKSIRAEFVRYKALAEAAFAQLTEADLSKARGSEDNSIAVIAWHISGNLRSRFTDFLTTDGEKPWRRRDEEFDQRAVTRAELDEKWTSGWSPLLSALDALTDDDLRRTVTIREQPMLVFEALHRSLAHLSYHVGQIVYVAKATKGADWKSLSIPRGQSQSYNQNPSAERPEAHAARLTK